MCAPRAAESKLVGRKYRGHYTPYNVILTENTKTRAHTGIRYYLSDRATYYLSVHCKSLNHVSCTDNHTHATVVVVVHGINLYNWRVLNNRGFFRFSVKKKKKGKWKITWEIKYYYHACAEESRDVSRRLVESRSFSRSFFHILYFIGGGYIFECVWRGRERFSTPPPSQKRKWTELQIVRIHSGLAPQRHFSNVHCILSVTLYLICRSSDWPSQSCEVYTVFSVWFRLTFHWKSWLFTVIS